MIFTVGCSEDLQVFHVRVRFRNVSNGDFITRHSPLTRSEDTIACQIILLAHIGLEFIHLSTFQITLHPLLRKFICWQFLPAIQLLVGVQCFIQCGVDLDKSSKLLLFLRHRNASSIDAIVEYCIRTSLEDILASPNECVEYTGTDFTNSIELLSAYLREIRQKLTSA